MIDWAEYPYGISQIIGMGIDCVAKKFGIKLNKIPFTDGDKEQVCSETAARLIVGAGFKIDDNLDRIGPNRLMEIVASIGRKI